MTAKIIERPIEARGHRLGDEDRTAQRIAERLDAACCIDRAADHREVEPRWCADIAEEDFAVVQGDAGGSGCQPAMAATSGRRRRVQPLELGAGLLGRRETRLLRRPSRVEAAKGKTASSPSPMNFSTSPPWSSTAPARHRSRR